MTLQTLESAQLTIEVSAKKGSHMFSKLPSKIKECIFIKSELFEHQVDVTIIPKSAAAAYGEAADNDTGSNYTYTGNNDSMQSSSRYSMASRSRQGPGGRNTALERMRSLSKEIRDPRSRGSSLQKSQLTNPGSKPDAYEDRIMRPDGKSSEPLGGTRVTRNADRPHLPLGSSQLGHSQRNSNAHITQTAHMRADFHVLQTEDLMLTAKDQETFREQDDG